VEKEKKFACNPGNCATLASLYNSDYPEDWIGKRVQIFAKEGVRAVGGGTTTGLRIRDFIPAGNDEVKKKAIQKQIRAALVAYKGEDMESIKQMLKDKVAAKEDSIEFYEITLADLKKVTA
jgi:hypothetical protein